MKRKVLNKKKVLVLGFMLIFIGLLILSLFKILFYLKDNKSNREIQKVVSEAITITPSDKIDEIYSVNFKQLREQNADTVAYLKVRNTNIDYVIVKGNDNEYYLNHNFNKEKNVSGWIFADYHNKFDGSDRNIVMYGHNTWDGSMFGSLKNVLDGEWYQNKDNHKITFITEEGIYTYQVFSTYVIASEDYYIMTNFSDDIEFQTFLKNLRFRSIYDYGVDVNEDDRIITLSTCSGDGKKRVVLHAKLIKEGV
jgi:sortase B